MKLSVSPLWSTRSEVAKRASYQSCKIFSNVEKKDVSCSANLCSLALEASKGAFYFWERVCGYCDYSACGYCCWLCYRSPSHRGAKSGCKLVTLFGGYSYDGVSAVIGVQNTKVPNQGASWWHF